MKRIEKQRQSGISANVLARLGKDEYVSMESIDKNCRFPQCNIGDAMEISTEQDNIDNKERRGMNNV